MNVKNLIYLDMDGVMCLSNSPLGKGNFFIFNDYSLNVLKTLLSVENTFIIISSSWKNYKTVDYLKDVVFKQYDISNFVLDKTPDLCFNDDNYSREDEIYEVLKKYPDCKHLILDDLSLDFSDYDLSFITGDFFNYQVDGSKGLVLSDSKKLYNFLTGGVFL